MQGGEKKRYAKAKVKVEKGDEIVFAPEYHESQGIGSLQVEMLKIRLISSKGQKASRVKTAKKGSK